MTDHIDPSIISFLTELKLNNNKDWFLANRQRYDAAKSLFLSFVEQMIADVNAIDASIGHHEPAECIYRINRDIRFSPDKSPYKRHFAAFVSPDGRQGTLPGYYLHVQPGESFFSSGNCCLTAEPLKRLRTEIANFPEDLHAIVTNPTFRSRLTLSDQDKLKTAPRGFHVDEKYADYIKYKTLCATVSYSDEELTAPGFARKLAADMALARPLNDFFRRALETEPDDDVAL